MNRTAAFVAAGLSFIPALTASAQLKLGAMGDSLTDEYAEETYNYAKNWLEQLRAYRPVDVGPTAAEAAQPGGTWGEPRRKFFRYNWARSGATSSTVLSDGQHTGLAAQYASLGVDHAILLIGANDFSPSSSAFFNIYNGLWSTATINSYIAGRISNVTTATDTVRASGMDLAIATFVDYSVAPITKSLFPDPVKRERVSAVIRQVNAGLDALARSRKLPLIDVYRLGSAVFGTNAALHSTLAIGGQDINLNDKDTSTNTKKLAGFVHDGVHPHTTIQGVFSNVMMTMANIAWHAGLPTFTEQEILAHASLPYLGVDELYGQLGDYRDYVTNYACLADFDKSGFVDIDDYGAFIQTFEAGDDAADFDGSGFVDIDDFSEFVHAFEEGC